MSWPALILRALQFLLLLAQAVLTERYRQEGRREVEREQQDAHVQAYYRAKEIEAAALDADLDDLRKRMRPYQRDGP